MVDPLEAKRLAAKQMQEFKAKEKLKVKELPFPSINLMLYVVGVMDGFKPTLSR